MAIANTSSTRLAVVKEVTWGTTPATPTFLNLRYTGEGIQPVRQNVTSNEIRADRNVADLVQVGGSAQGDVQLEWAYGNGGLEAILESLMFSSWATNVLVNGTTQTSLTVEKTFDHGATKTYMRAKGMVANTLSLSLSANAIATGSVGFMGADLVSDTAIVTGATYTSVNTKAVMNASTGFAALTVGGVTSPKVRSISLNATNNLRAQQVVGQTANAGIGAGRFELTGSMEVYLEDKTLLDLFLAGTASSMAFTMGTVTNEKYKWEIPNLKFDSIQIAAGGNDADAMVSVNWRGLYDATTAGTLKITRAVA